MAVSRLQSSGFTLGSLQVPAFSLAAGEWLSLLLPGPADSADAENLVAVLTAERRQPGVSVYGRVVHAVAVQPPTGLRGLLPHPHARNWLRREAGISTESAAAIIRKIGPRADNRVGRVPWTARVLLGLEAAWARGAETLIFTTVGLDPRGCATVFAAVQDRLAVCSAIHLSYPVMTNGRWERLCPPGATRVEVKSLPVSSTSALPMRDAS